MDNKNIYKDKIKEIINFKDIFYKYICFKNDMNIKCFYNKISEKNIKYLRINGYGIFIFNSMNNEKDIFLTINWNAITDFIYEEKAQDKINYLYFNFQTIYSKSFSLWQKKEENTFQKVQKHINFFKDKNMKKKIKKNIEAVNMKNENIFKSNKRISNVKYICNNLRRIFTELAYSKDEDILNKFKIKVYNNDYLIKSYPKSFWIPDNSDNYINGTIEFRSKNRIPALSNIFINKNKEISYVWRSAQPNVF